MNWLTRLLRRVSRVEHRDNQTLITTPGGAYVVPDPDPVSGIDLSSRIFNARGDEWIEQTWTSCARPDEQSAEPDDDGPYDWRRDGL